MPARATHTRKHTRARTHIITTTRTVPGLAFLMGSSSKRSRAHIVHTHEHIPRAHYPCSLWKFVSKHCQQLTHTHTYTYTFIEYGCDVASPLVVKTTGEIKRNRTHLVGNRVVHRTPRPRWSGGRKDGPRRRRD